MCHSQVHRYLPLCDSGRSPSGGEAGDFPERPKPNEASAAAGVRRLSARALTEITPARPRVSVIVTCYNYGHWLDACVESALTQAGVDVDVLLINDASSDDSSRVAHRLAAHAPVALLEARPEVGFAYGRALYFGRHAPPGNCRRSRRR